MKEEIGNSKFLPIGSIIILKNNNHKLMITGIKVKCDDKIYDYMCCFYPYGVLKYDENILVNSKEIKDVVSLGYIDDEGTQYHEHLKQTYLTPKDNNITGLLPDESNKTVDASS